jgi:hypothetical protein
MHFERAFWHGWAKQVRRATRSPAGGSYRLMTPFEPRWLSHSDRRPRRPKRARVAVAERTLRRHCYLGRCSVGLLRQGSQRQAQAAGAAQGPRRPKRARVAVAGRTLRRHCYLGRCSVGLLRQGSQRQAQAAGAAQGPCCRLKILSLVVGVEPYSQFSGGSGEVGEDPVAQAGVLVQGRHRERLWLVG